MKCSILALWGRDHTGSSEGQWFTIDITVQAGVCSEVAEINDKITYGSKWYRKVEVGKHGREWFLNVIGLKHLRRCILLTHNKML